MAGSQVPHLATLSSQLPLVLSTSSEPRLVLLGVPPLPRGARFPPRVGSPDPRSAGTETGSAACGEGARRAPGWLWPLLRWKNSLELDLSAGRVTPAGVAWGHPLLPPLPPVLPPPPTPVPVGEKAKGLTGVATSATLPRGVAGLPRGCSVTLVAADSEACPSEDPLLKTPASWAKLSWDEPLLEAPARWVRLMEVDAESRLDLLALGDGGCPNAEAGTARGPCCLGEDGCASAGTGATPVPPASPCFREEGGCTDAGGAAASPLPQLGLWVLLSCWSSGDCRWAAPLHALLPRCSLEDVSVVPPHDPPGSPASWKALGASLPRPLPVLCRVPRRGRASPESSLCTLAESCPAGRSGSGVLPRRAGGRCSLLPLPGVGSRTAASTGPATSELLPRRAGGCCSLLPLHAGSGAAASSGLLRFRVGWGEARAQVPRLGSGPEAPISSPRGACACTGGGARSEPLLCRGSWACRAAVGLRGAAAAWSADALLLGACTHGHMQPGGTTSR